MSKINIIIGLMVVGAVALIVSLGLKHSITVYEQDEPAKNMASATRPFIDQKTKPKTVSVSTASTSIATTTTVANIAKAVAKIESIIKSISNNIPKDKMPPNMKWGVYTGWHDSSLLDFETLTDKKPDMEMVFVHWGNEATFPSYYGKRIRDKGRTMVLFWEASDYKRGVFNQPEFSYDNVLRGDLDFYFVKFAEGAKLYGGEIILIPYSEFNGNWYPWGGTIGDNSKEKHIASYRYIHKFFKGVTNVKFGWVPNAYSVPNVPENKIELFYPGNEYVDYVGVNGFNFGGDEEMSFNELFGDALHLLKKYKKPIYLFSIATADGPNKAEWIKNMMTVELYKYPEIKGWLWFNQDKERDWRVNSDPESLKTFVSVLP